jgi:hypothetical protein
VAVPTLGPHPVNKSRHSLALFTLPVALDPLGEAVPGLRYVSKHDAMLGVAISVHHLPALLSFRPALLASETLVLSHIGSVRQATGG